MRLEDAQRFLGKRMAVNANGGQLFAGKLISICEEPSITLEVEGGRRVHLNIIAVDGWVVEGTPPRLGGERVAA